MNYIAIFEDEKGFNKTLELEPLEFEHLPLIYRLFYPGDKEMVFRRDEGMVEVHGNYIKRYKLILELPIN